jgi:hypothetical protein
MQADLIRRHRVCIGGRSLFGDDLCVLSLEKLAERFEKLSSGNDAFLESILDADLKEFLQCTLRCNPAERMPVAQLLNLALVRRCASCRVVNSSFSRPDMSGSSYWPPNPM